MNLLLFSWAFRHTYKRACLSAPMDRWAKAQCVHENKSISQRKSIIKICNINGIRHKYLCFCHKKHSHLLKAYWHLLFSRHRMSVQLSSYSPIRLFSHRLCLYMLNFFFVWIQVNRWHDYILKNNNKCLAPFYTFCSITKALSHVHFYIEKRYGKQIVHKYSFQEYLKIFFKNKTKRKA